MAYFNPRTSQIELSQENRENLQHGLPKDWLKNIMSFVMCDDIRVDWKKVEQRKRDEAYKQNSD